LWEGKFLDALTHNKTCPYEVVQCEYYDVGCMKELYRKDLMEHNQENSEEHLAQCRLKIRKLEQTLYQFNMSGIYQANISARGTWCVHLGELAMITDTSGEQVCPVIVKVPEFASMKRDNKQWYSNSFYTHDHGYKLRLLVYPAGYGDCKGTHLSVFLCLMKGPHDDELKWPLRGKFELKLLNQTSDHKHDSNVVNFDCHTSGSVAGRVITGNQASCGWGFCRFISNESLYKITSKCQYLKDNCVFFQVKKLI